MNKVILIIVLLFTKLTTFVQETMQEVEMADLMRSNGKIYVVVAVSTIILTGLILYLVTLDKRISKLEKEINR
jgi:hypothetical protein